MPTPPPPVRGRDLILVAAGGSIGTLIRHIAETAADDRWSVPVEILLVNVTGAFLLGWLASSLARDGDSPRNRGRRLLLGAGLLGGYTTYGAIAADTARYLLDGESLVGAAYLLGTLVLGALSCIAGLLVGDRR